MDGWPTTDKLTFTTDIEDIAAKYELQLIIDHLDTYRYENIYLKIFTKFPDQPDKEEQLSVSLADKKGNWVGNCSGNSCKCKVFLLDDFKFATQGSYTFELGQYTRDDPAQKVSF